MYPTVSVIVPTRDRPALLVRALQSILGQTYPGLVECAVVFDQTEPISPAIPVPENRRLVLLRNERTPGLPGSRNTGILSTKGDLVAICDDDDEWLPDKLQRQIEALTKSRDAGAATCGLLIHTAGRVILRKPLKKRLDVHDFLRSRQIVVNSSTLLAWRWLFERVGLYDEAIPGGYGEDYEWLLRASSVTPIVAVSDPLARIYRHSGTWFAGRWPVVFEALSYILAKHEGLAWKGKGLARIYGQLAFAAASCGRFGEARQLAKRCLRLNPLELRGYLALLVSLGLVNPDRILLKARSLGRGI